MASRMKVDTNLPQLLHSGRLLIATNRGPVEFYLNREKKLKYRRGVGGVVTALIDAGNSMEMTWVALAMTEGDRIASKKAEQNDGLFQSPLCSKKIHLRYVTIPVEAYHKHYYTISNEILWFLQHYLYDIVEDYATACQIQDAWKNGYCVANQAIADAVNAEIESEGSPAVVMLHGQHLYLAPAMIRRRQPSVVIQEFIHVPWPEVRCWHFLPLNIMQSIYSSLICSDVLGFQTQRDAHNFLEGVQTVLDGAVIDFEEGVIWWQGRRTLVRTYPISISVEGERRIVQSAAGERASEKILPLLNEKTIMRVDRIDPTKNILRGFQAYAQILDEHPDLLGKVTFLAFLIPSRQALSEYKQYKARILKIINEINRTYGSDKWRPIQVFSENDRTRALAAMQFYDVLLVNPIMDGMNLIAKEGPVVNKRDGVLILSRTAGAFQQLEMASIAISPFDIKETSEALYKALYMSSEERNRRATLARQAIESYDLNIWLREQIDDINELLKLSSFSFLPNI